MKVIYYENKDLAVFDELHFRRDKHTGYYLNSAIHKRLHAYVWEYYNGNIPDGYQIHHIDHDKGNNDIENLKLVSAKEHSEIHSKEMTPEQKEWYRKNLNENARPKAIEWHKSDKSREWHKKHYEETKDKFHRKEFKICECCGEKFIGTPISRFCSNKCKSKWRRDNHLDDEIRTCAYCGKKFTINKYSKTKTCSRSCSNKLTPRLPRLRD